jgi:hypothetical protein
MAGTLNLDCLVTIAARCGAVVRLLGTTGSWPPWSPAARCG